MKKNMHIYVRYLYYIQRFTKKTTKNENKYKKHSGMRDPNL